MDNDRDIKFDRVRAVNIQHCPISSTFDMRVDIDSRY